MCFPTEGSQLLSSSNKQHASWTIDESSDKDWRMAMKQYRPPFWMGFGSGLLVAVVAACVMLSSHSHHGDSHVWMRQTNSHNKDHHPLSSSSSSSHSKYSHFQAVGFQIFTGGASAFLDSDKGTLNPECQGLQSFGHADDFDTFAIDRNETDDNKLLWQCYVGLANATMDVQERLKIMTAAVERAHASTTNDSSTLKIFIAPEFFWRGQDGAYLFPMEEDPNECSEVCQILQGLEGLVAHAKYQDWLFLFGTVVAAEELPQEDEFDFLFYNFAPVYKGYDPAKTNHHGKRFLVPKRYISNIDFLTPLRKYNATATQELFDWARQEPSVDDDTEPSMMGHIRMEEDSPSSSGQQQQQQQTVLINPFDQQKKDFYDRAMWYQYKDELAGLGYTMLESDWLILDNITFTIEVCLDHDTGTALNTFLADNVLGNPTLIPKSVEYPAAHGKTRGGIEQVVIPRHQAQLSLVSSAGMSINPQSLALVHNGTIVLQDGQSNTTTSLEQQFDCQGTHWKVSGGTECLSRTAHITSTRIEFEYHVRTTNRRVPVFSPHGWKDAVRNLFTTTRYAPELAVYHPRPIAQV